MAGEYDDLAHDRLKAARNHAILASDYALIEGRPLEEAIQELAYGIVALAKALDFHLPGTEETDE